jgi:RNA polymerase sigma-32 factor
MSKMSDIASTDIFQAAARQPMLEHEEESRLARKASCGDIEAAGQLILSHLRMVIKIARTYRGSGLPMSDLVQQGVLGLIHAVEKFNPDRGVRLSTYAMWWIRAAIQDHVVRSWSVVRIGTTNAQKALFLRLRQMTSDFFDSAGDLSDEIVQKLARGFDTTAADVRALVRRMARGGDQSLDHPASEAINTAASKRRGSWLDHLVCPRPNPEEALSETNECRFVADLIEKALGMLPPRERLIIERRYFAEVRATFDAIGREIGLSKDRVRQLERIALDRLRNMLQPALEKG